MSDDTLGDDLVIDEALVHKVKVDDGKLLYFNFLSRDEKKKLRDEHVITIIDDHVNADKVTWINLTGCVGITDATLVHISTKFTQLGILSVNRCDQITDDGIQAIVEKIGNKLITLNYRSCNRCSNAALQAIVQHCPNLQFLSANNTGITQIPDSIGTDLPKLNALNLRSNDIKRLPPSIALLSDTLTGFDISDNPLEDPPLEIAEEGLDAIVQYHEDQETQSIDPTKTSLPDGARQDPSYQKHFKKKKTFTKKNWKVVGTDFENWIKNVLGVVSGDVTSIIRTVDKLSSFGADKTDETDDLLFAEKVPPKISGDHQSFVAVKIEEKQTSKGAGFINFLRCRSETKSASAQIYCIQPANDAAHQQLEELGLNFADIEVFYDITFVKNRFTFKNIKPLSWMYGNSEALNK